ncbi:uncharacterized protein LOC120120900 [Hibiscus syriacus]|uniref:uncharacterized protein LOC120120900 n=1 Tax=Hibiscus syriacus TaxID=106335 RepID=UPI001923D2D0|nr:uncharacterized protein LOC120120900 [Hibiscus syriacus]
MDKNPNYIKFMKEVLSKKIRLGEFDIVALAEGCSATTTSQIPIKLKDPGSFTHPCIISDKFVGKASCDLDVIINLMTLSNFRKFGSGETRSSTVSLQLDDKSTIHPSGIIENMLV